MILLFYRFCDLLLVLSIQCTLASGQDAETAILPTISLSAGAAVSTSSPAPSDVHVAGDTNSPDNMPTSEPSTPPELTDTPTFVGTNVWVEIRGVTVSFVGVGELSADDVVEYQSKMALWFDDFYSEQSRNEARDLSEPRFSEVFDVAYPSTKRMAQNIDVRGMRSAIDVTSQTLHTEGVRVVHTHSLRYAAGTGCALKAEELVLLPYTDTNANAQLAADLRSVATFSDIVVPINLPLIETPLIDANTDPPTEYDDQFLRLPAIIGISIGAAAFCGLVLYFAFSRSAKKDRGGTGYGDRDPLPPSQITIDATEDISTIQESTVARGWDNETSVAQCGDQR